MYLWHSAKEVLLFDLVASQDLSCGSPVVLCNAVTYCSATPMTR